MPNIFQSAYRQQALLPLLILLSGCAALSWEVIWQIRTGLALGVSAWGTAVTLAVTMGGMSLGALMMGRLLKDRQRLLPVRLYGMLECLVGLSGLCLPWAFGMLTRADTHLYTLSPAAAPLVYGLGIILIIGLPVLCLGATLPVIGLAAQKYRTSIALLYGLNTLGAAGGTMLAAFVLIPALGITGTGALIAAVNITVGLTAITIDREDFTPAPAQPDNVQARTLPVSASLMVVFITGFATFALEVAWFRSLTAAFKSTTDSFAIMLACVLLALGIGARIAPKLRRSGFSLGVLLAWAGLLILCATPLIERFDLVAFQSEPSALYLIAKWFAMTLFTVSMPVILLGIPLPWLLDEQDNPRDWGALYAFNAFAAILGALAAAWILLPLLGFAATAWLAGSLTALTGLLYAPSKKRAAHGILLVAAIAVATTFQSGVGRTRVQIGADMQTTKILAAYEGPDATTSAIETEDSHRMLVINGFIATLQMGEYGAENLPTHYMPWMGHLPMLVHPDPQTALVICFGTGQTANAVRRENPDVLDIVDINPRVFQMADLFPANENVLADPRVIATTMDGRVFLRRTPKTYDVITLEPMPPNFAGVNALYSQEFYRLARSKLGPDGVIAQWLPFHLVHPYYSASITRTFQSVFPNAILWIDKLSSTGILLGTKDDSPPLGDNLYGYNRPDITRDLTAAQVRDAIALNSSELERYAATGELITDDNQALAYGEAAFLSHFTTRYTQRNMDYIKDATGKDMTPYLPPMADAE